MNFDYHNIDGVDISTYQDSPNIVGNVNFHRMRDYGMRFVIIKASQADYRDLDFGINWINSKGILPRSSYHYFDNTVSPKVQANRFWNTIKGDVEGICWFDLEDQKLGTYGNLKSWYDCISEFQRLSGLPDERIGIYTRRSYWMERTVFNTQAEKNWFSRFYLWLAIYVPDPFHPDYSSILVPSPWTEVLLVQLGTPIIGLDVGVESKEVDYDQFNGTEEKFQTIFGKVIPGEPMEITLTANLKSGETSRLRSSPGLDGSIQRLLVGPLSIQGVGEKVQVDGYYWIQVVYPYAGYVALTTSYENVVYTPPILPVGDHLEIIVNGVKILDMTGKINAG